MKTNEFIKNLEKLNLYVQEHQDTIFIQRNVNGYFIAYISKTKRFTFNADFRNYEELYTETKSKLLDLIVAYAKTPIKERETPMKYRLRLKIAKYFTDSYMYFLNRSEKDLFLSTDQQQGEYQTEFTQSEIDELPKEIIEIFDKIEVGDEE